MDLERLMERIINPKGGESDAILAKAFSHFLGTVSIPRAPLDWQVIRLGDVRVELAITIPGEGLVREVIEAPEQVSTPAVIAKRSQFFLAWGHHLPQSGEELRPMAAVVHVFRDRTGEIRTRMAAVFYYRRPRDGGGMVTPGTWFCSTNGTDPRLVEAVVRFLNKQTTAAAPGGSLMVGDEEGVDL